jgi:hypothetical protein
VLSGSVLIKRSSIRPAIDLLLKTRLFPPRLCQKQAAALNEAAESADSGVAVAAGVPAAVAPAVA